METLKVRHADYKDSKVVSAFIQEYGKLFGRTLSNVGHEEYIENHVKNGSFKCLLAELQAENDVLPMGIIIFHESYSTWTGKGLMIQMFYSHSHCKASQVKDELLKMIAKIAISENCSRIAFECSYKDPTAMQYFESKGAINLTKTIGWQNYRFRLENIV